MPKEVSKELLNVLACPAARVALITKERKASLFAKTASAKESTGLRRASNNAG